MAVLIAKFVPTVRSLVNFFQRHVTEPTKPENVDDLEEAQATVRSPSDESPSCRVGCAVRCAGGSAP